MLLKQQKLLALFKTIHMKNKIPLFLLIAFALVSCKKEEAATAQEHEPVVTFLSPLPMQLYNEQDTLWLRLNLTSEDDLHEYLVQVRDVVADKIVYSYEGHSHDKSASVNLYMMPDVSMDTEMELIVTTLDHNSNKSVKSISFKIKDTVKEGKPVITILSPAATMYNNGEQIKISGYVTHYKTLKTVHVQLMQNNEPVLSFQPLWANADSVGFDTSYIIHSPAYSDFELVVTATDEEEHAAVKTYSFHVHP